jgi:hypothetical protein
VCPCVRLFLCLLCQWWCGWGKATNIMCIEPAPVPQVGEVPSKRKAHTNLILSTHGEDEDHYQYPIRISTAVHSYSISVYGICKLGLNETKRIPGNRIAPFGSPRTAHFWEGKTQIVRQEKEGEGLGWPNGAIRPRMRSSRGELTHTRKIGTP